MTDLELVPLNTVSEGDLLALMNDPRVGRHLPLLTGTFTSADCNAFLAAKQALWDTHGWGPYAFLIGGRFAGWGGLQAEGDDADFALVLHPDFWGWGRKIFERIRKDAFGQLGLPSITALLPPGRPNRHAITRLGFVAEDEMTLGGHHFVRFRLMAS